MRARSLGYSSGSCVNFMRGGVGVVGEEWIGASSSKVVVVIRLHQQVSLPRRSLLLRFIEGGNKKKFCEIALLLSRRVATTPCDVANT